jgi:flagellar basal body-associated protein FliL
LKDWIGNMRWLKSIVIVLGILIVLGIVLLGYGFYKKTSEPSWKPFSEQDKSIEEQQSIPLRQQQITKSFNSFGSLSLNLADGCLITKVEIETHYAFFMVGPTPACNAVILVDIQKSVVLGRFTPQP